MYPESIRLSSGDAESLIREPGDTQPESVSVRLSLGPWKRTQTTISLDIYTPTEKSTVFRPLNNLAILVNIANVDNCILQEG